MVYAISRLRTCVTQSPDCNHVIRNLEIVQILRLCGTYISTKTCQLISTISLYPWKKLHDVFYVCGWYITLDAFRTNVILLWHLCMYFYVFVLVCSCLQFHILTCLPQGQPLLLLELCQLARMYPQITVCV